MVLAQNLQKKLMYPNEMLINVLLWQRYIRAYTETCVHSFIVYMLCVKKDKGTDHNLLLYVSIASTLKEFVKISQCLLRLQCGIVFFDSCVSVSLDRFAL